MSARKTSTIYPRNPKFLTSTPQRSTAPARRYPSHLKRFFCAAMIATSAHPKASDADTIAGAVGSPPSRTRAASPGRTLEVYQPRANPTPWAQGLGG